MPTSISFVFFSVPGSTENSVIDPDQRLATAACLPSALQATAIGLRPHGTSASTLPATTSTSDTESAP